MVTAYTPVGVTCKFDIDGKVKPLSIQLEDGRQYEIDRITEVLSNPTFGANGCPYGGRRYTVWFGSHQRYLIFSRDDKQIGKWVLMK